MNIFSYLYYKKILNSYSLLVRNKIKLKIRDVSIFSFRYCRFYISYLYDFKEYKYNFRNSMISIILILA